MRPDETSKITQEQRRLLAENEAILLEPQCLDAAIIDVTEDRRAVYGFEELVQAFMEMDGVTREEAEEWVDYNTTRAIPYMGEKGPSIKFPWDLCEGEA